ncbi:hypothetical protein EC396_04295 [Lutibacter sp. HS1-25]|nr:hypothetical protein EC396_04295 [Lutibacter sp. HS1-25]
MLIFLAIHLGAFQGIKIKYFFFNLYDNYQKAKIKVILKTFSYFCSPTKLFIKLIFKPIQILFIFE